MKIYNHEDFLKLPSGTIYLEITNNLDKVNSICTSSISIKGRNNDEGDDFLLSVCFPYEFYDQFVSIGESLDYQYFKNVDEEINLDQAWNKDYKCKNYYIVLEKKDWEKIKELVDKSYG